LAQKLSFTVENVEMYKENPDSNFALLALDFFASGDNLHHLYVSEDTLLKTADTIKNCPLVWKYDKVLDDIYTHDPEEVPCGFVPESSEIKKKKLSDGRTMLSTVAYVWKRYTGPLLSIFKRDKGTKPVSVEMSVYETRETDDGKTEILDFRYEGVTVLGSFVTPAIPMANASVLSFSDLKDEYEEDFENEFSTDKIIIPGSVRRTAEKGLEWKKLHGGGTSTGLAFARFLTDNKTINLEKVLEISNYFSTHKNYKGLTHSDSSISEDIDWLLWGGDSSKEWAERVKRMNELITFPYKSIGEINPALKGITPPISLAQANAIANQADSIGTDENKNGWAIAIASFRKTHHVVNGKWVKNKGSTAKAALSLEEEENMANEDFAKENMGKGEAIKVNKSKDAMSTSPWGDVDKTALRNKVLEASNYKSLVHDVYIAVDAGWEDHPSESLRYPVMQISGDTAVYNRYGLSNALLRARQQNESGIASKIAGIYKKLGLEDSGKDEKEAMSWAADEEKKIEEAHMTEEAEKKAAEEALMAAEEEAEKKAAEEALMAAEEEAKEKEELAKMAAENEEKRKAAEEEEARKKAAEEEAKKIADKKSEFSLPVSEMAKFFADDDEAEETKMAKEEIAKGDDANFGIILNAIYNKFCNMKEMMAKAEEEKKAYMAENEELRRIKSEVEAEQKKFAINETLKELEASAYLPDEVKAEMREDAENYTLENLEVWKNNCKAKAFDFAIRQPADPGVIKVGLPFGGITKQKDDIWS
jgi:hypothetical protein